MYGHRYPVGFSRPCAMLPRVLLSAQMIKRMNNLCFPQQTQRVLQGNKTSERPRRAVVGVSGGRIRTTRDVFGERSNYEQLHFFSSDRRRNAQRGTKIFSKQAQVAQEAGRPPSKLSSLGIWQNQLIPAALARLVLAQPGGP